MTEKEAQDLADALTIEWEAAQEQRGCLEPVKVIVAETKFGGPKAMPTSASAEMTESGGDNKRLKQDKKEKKEKKEKKQGKDAAGTDAETPKSEGM